MYPDPRNTLQSLWPMAKTRAIPGSHRDNYLPKEQHLCPDVSPGNAYSLNRRAVSIHARPIFADSLLITKQMHEISTNANS